MESIDYKTILEKLGPEKNFSNLTEDELYVYDLIKAIKHTAALEEKNKISQAINQSPDHSKIGTSFDPPANPSIFPFKWKIWYNVAASIALIIITFLILRTNSADPNEIFTLHFKPEAEYIIKAKENLSQYGMIDQQAESRDSILKGLELYETKNYKAAIALLTDYSIHYPEQYTARFYLALAQMNENQFEAAEINLAILNDNNQLEFLHEVKWNYALCLLKINNGIPKAKMILQQLVQSNGKYALQATEILKSL